MYMYKLDGHTGKYQRCKCAHYGKSLYSYTFTVTRAKFDSMWPLYCRQTAAGCDENSISTAAQLYVCPFAISPKSFGTEEYFTRNSVFFRRGRRRRNVSLTKLNFPWRDEDYDDNFNNFVNVAKISVDLCSSTRRRKLSEGRKLFRHKFEIC